MEQNSRAVVVKIKCPSCSLENEIYIDSTEFERASGGLIRIPIEHVVPQPHILVVDVDIYGTPRSAYIIKDYSITGGISISAILDAIGIDNLSKILAWLLIYDDVDIYGHDPNIVKLVLMLLNQIFEGFKKVSTNRKDAKVRFNIFNVPRPSFSLDLINRRLRLAIKNISDPSSLIAFLKNELIKYLTHIEIFEKVIEEVESPLSLSDLARISGSNLLEEEIKFILTVLKAKGVNLSRKVDIPEFKVTELF